MRKYPSPISRTSFESRASILSYFANFYLDPSDLLLESIISDFYIIFYNYNSLNSNPIEYWKSVLQNLSLFKKVFIYFFYQNRCDISKSQNKNIFSTRSVVQMRPPQ